MNPMMMNNEIINQTDQNKIFQLIQKNNEQIIQMLQQIFQVQMLNNMLLNQILTNKKLNNNNNFNNMMNPINNTLNNMNINMMNNQNMQNIMNNNMMNSNVMNMINNNDNDIDPWEGNTAHRINIHFDWLNNWGGHRRNLSVPINITVTELIEGFIKKFKAEKENIYFLFNSKKLKNKDSRKIEEIGMCNGCDVHVIEYGC